MAFQQKFHFFLSVSLIKGENFILPSKSFSKICTEGSYVCTLRAYNPKNQILSGKEKRQMFSETQQRTLFSNCLCIVQKMDKTCHLNCVRFQTGKLRFFLEKALPFLLFLPSRTSSHLQPKQQKIQLKRWKECSPQEKAQFKIIQCAHFYRREHRWNLPYFSKK